VSLDCISIPISICISIHLDGCCLGATIFKHISTFNIMFVQWTKWLEKRFIHFDEQESHKCASQNRARRAFVLIKLILFIYFWNNQSFRLIRPLFMVWCRLKPFEAALKLSFGPWTVWTPLTSIIWRKSWNVLILFDFVLMFWSAKVFFKVNYSFKRIALWDTVYSAYV